MGTVDDAIDKMLVCDGNAAAGILNEIFASEMTTSTTKCARCGEEAEIGVLMAF